MSEDPSFLCMFLRVSRITSYGLLFIQIGLPQSQLPTFLFEDNVLASEHQDESMTITRNFHRLVLPTQELVSFSILIWQRSYFVVFPAI
jgi:hypothetical protein